MNRKDGYRDGSRPKTISDCLKDRDEELSFFRDIQKRGKEQVSLLHPVSEEFDANGNYGLYRMESVGRKGTTGLEFFGEATAKNDYNWLKTPPATPLFPSLEMETNGQEMVVQKEIPIIKPLTRFSGNDKGANTRSNSNYSKPKLAPPRYKAPNARQIIPPTDKKTMKTPNTKRTTDPEPNFLATNLAKSVPMTTNPKSRGISPSVRQRISSQIKEVSAETPANLRTTNRPESVTRGRPTTQIKQADIGTTKTRSRESCSPSVTRGRKAETNGKVSQQTGKGTQVLGSKMVEKLMNARISNAEQRRGKISSRDVVVSSSEGRVEKIKLHGSLIERSGFGRFTSKS